MAGLEGRKGNGEILLIISKSYKFLKVKKNFPLAVYFMFNLYRRNFSSIQIAYHQQVPPT